MSATSQDVQAKLDKAVTSLAKSTSSYPQMVKRYGSDWKKWPTNTSWYIALSNITAARTEVGSLTTKVLNAEFSYKGS